MGLTIRRLYLAGAFTLAGKRRARPHHVAACLAAAGAALLLPALARAGAPGAPAGPTSSASVEIRVSVAPGYGLSGIRGSSSTAARGLCIATNSQPTLLPVMLVMEPEAGNSAVDRRQLAWCNPGDSKVEAGAGRRVLIVSPE
jgi:hypothetical protein